MALSYHKVMVECLTTISKFTKRKLQTGKYPFKIPAPIERSPTDLLQALADTVKDDETAPDFAYIDDPFTIPTSILQRKTYSLSKEFGRRTARRFAEEWPTLFMFDRDQPQLAAFRPQKPLSPMIVEPTEENLSRMIKGLQVTDAVKLYEKMIDAEKEISEVVKTSIFHLLCYYNESDIPIDEQHWIASRIYSLEEKKLEEVQEWKGKELEPALAEKLFVELPKTDEKYSILICGLCKFRSLYSMSQARILYEEMVSAGHVPHEEVFNYLIRSRVHFEDDPVFEAGKWLEEMARFGIRPSIYTFNSLFETLIQLEKDGLGVSPTASNWDFALAQIAAMNNLEIEPSLTVYWATVELAPDDQTQINALDEILRRLEDKLERGGQIEFTDLEDQKFLFTALVLAGKTFNEDLLDRLLRIYMHKRNRVRIQNPWEEQRFYFNYLIPKSYLTSLDNFMPLYRQFVPNFCPLSIALAMTIFKEMAMRKPDEFCWPLLKRLVADCITSHLTRINDVSTIAMQQLRDVKPHAHLSEPEAKDYVALSERLIYAIEQHEKWVEELLAAREKMRVLREEESKKYREMQQQTGKD